MKNRLKKILCVLSFLTLLSGCSEKGPTLNKDRPTNYTYDFVDYIDISVYGNEGNGFIEIHPKEIVASDFPTESDYIAVKKIIDSLGLYVGPDTSKVTYIGVDKNEGLSNGDIVTIGVKNTWSYEGSGISFNIAPYEYQIEGLKEGTTLNFFDNSAVMFYGLNGTDDVYALTMEGGSIPSDLLNVLQYTISAESQPLSADQTILNVSVGIKNDVLTEGDDPAFTTERYLGRSGYVADLTAEKVLSVVVDPIDFQSVNVNEMKSAIDSFLLNDHVKINGQTATNINSVNATPIVNDLFNYKVNFTADINGENRCVSVTLRMVELDGRYIVAEKTSSYSISSNSCEVSDGGLTINLSNGAVPTTAPNDELIGNDGLIETIEPIEDITIEDDTVSNSTEQNSAVPTVLPTINSVFNVVEGTTH